MTPPNSNYVFSATFHEAGHEVVAAICGFPLGTQGMVIDERGQGHASYIKPDGSNRTDLENRIIVAFAGLVAQQELYQRNIWGEFPHDGAVSDLDEILSLLDKMNLNRMDLHSTQNRLRGCCHLMVVRNWKVIEALADALWSREWTPQGVTEEKWSTGERHKSMTGEEVSEVLTQLGIDNRLEQAG